MRTRIRDVLVKRILDGTYPAGFRFKELSLAREFNVSQAPIREALRELGPLGLVVTEHYRGTYVRTTDMSELAEAYELRAVIEVRSVELASPYPTEVLDDLQAQLRRLEAAVESGDQEAHAEAALNFHRQLVAACGNKSFLQTWDSFHWEVRARIAIRSLATGGDIFRSIVPAHAELLALLREGDAAAAAAKVRHIFDQLIATLTSEMRQ